MCLLIKLNNISDIQLILRLRVDCKQSFRSYCLTVNKVFVPLRVMWRTYYCMYAIERSGNRSITALETPNSACVSQAASRVGMAFRKQLALL